MTSSLDIGLYRISGYLARRRWLLSPGACAQLRRKGDNERTNERTSKRARKRKTGTWTGRERRKEAAETIEQREGRIHEEVRRGGEIALTHNTIRRLRLLRWILKDPRDYYFFLFFHFHSSIIISEERGADGCARATLPYHPPLILTLLLPVSFSVSLPCVYTYTAVPSLDVAGVCVRIGRVPGWARLGLGWVGCVETMDDFG